MRRLSSVAAAAGLARCFSAPVVEPQHTADLILQARKAHMKMEEGLPEQFKPVTEGTAYTMQDAFAAKLERGKRIGYKIGATNQGARTTLKLEQPFYGVLFEGLTSKSGVSFAADKMYLRVVEPEVALEIGEDLDASKINKFDAEIIQKATAKVFPAIEIVDTPFAAKWKEVGGYSLIADNGAHGQFILGEGVEPSKLDATGVKVNIEVNGKVEREGVGSNVDGGAYAATAWLATFLASRGISLKKGDIITTGTTTVPWVGGANEEIKASFEGVGSCSFKFN